MVIVSQDRTEIYNFDNITYINISDNYIRIHTINSINCNIGKYETETRAKEVLNEIIDNLKNKAKIEGKFEKDYADDGTYEAKSNNMIYKMPIA